MIAALNDSIAGLPLWAWLLWWVWLLIATPAAGALGFWLGFRLGWRR